MSKEVGAVLICRGSKRDSRSFQMTVLHLRHQYSPSLPSISPHSKPIQHRPNDSSATYTTCTSAIVQPFSGTITKIGTTQSRQQVEELLASATLSLGIMVLRPRVQTLHVWVHCQCNDNCARAVRLVGLGLVLAVVGLVRCTAHAQLVVVPLPLNGLDTACSHDVFML
jgi:hypothetical protein